MLNFKTIGKKAGITILLSAIVSTPAAFANDTSELAAKMEALSYAPEGSNLDERFSQFEFETDEYAEHELNDAWLGMPAYSSNGKLVGYIDDAILDDEGYVTELIVGLNQNKGIAEIKGKFAELTDEKVQFALSRTQIAALASEYKLASLAE